MKSTTTTTTTTTNTQEATQKVMVAKLTRLTHNIAIQLHLAAESCTICSSHSRKPVQKLFDTLSYTPHLEAVLSKTQGETMSQWQVNLLNIVFNSTCFFFLMLTHIEIFLITEFCLLFGRNYWLVNTVPVH
jgi:hypothetical protein